MITSSTATFSNSSFKTLSFNSKIELANKLYLYPGSNASTYITSSSGNNISFNTIYSKSPHVTIVPFDIYAPSLLVKNDGIIKYFDDEDAIVHGETNANDYFDNYRTNLKKITLKSVLEDYKKNENKSN